MMKANWGVGNALKGDSRMESRLIPCSCVASVQESLYDVKINDGTEQALAKRPQKHRIMDDLTFRRDRYHNFRVCTSGPRCIRISFVRETLLTWRSTRSRTRPFILSKLLVVGLSFRGAHRAVQLVVATSRVYRSATLPARDYRY